MTSADLELEDRIFAARLQWEAALGPWKLREAFRKFRELVSQRSPDAVRELEKTKGLV